MANWNKPDLSSYEVNVLDELKNRDLSLARMFKGTTDTNLPVDTIRLEWSGLVGAFGKWNGTDWDTLTLSQNNLPSATSSAKGIAKIATPAEITARTSADTIVPPSGLSSARVASADKLTSSRTITVGNTGKSFDGSGDISFSLSEIGAVDLTNNQTIGGNKTFSSDLIVNGLKVGRGGGANNSNTTVGVNALRVNTTGIGNSAFGVNAMFSNTTGSDNSAFGTNTLFNNTEGIRNSAFGANALTGVTTGNSNNAFGWNALNYNTTGDNNNAFGSLALSNNTTGNNNNAFGQATLTNNTTGYWNTAVGHSALLANTTGYLNTAVGHSALPNNTTGYWNTAVGQGALRTNTTGSGNIAIGISAGTESSPFHITNQSNRIVLGDNIITHAYIKVAWTVISDERDKTEITDLPVGLDFLNNLRPVSYQFKQGGRESDTGDGITRYGFLAQQVLGVEGDNPVLVDTEQEEHLKLKESNLIAVLVKAVQELSAKVELLESQLTNK